MTSNPELAERFWKAIKTRKLHERWRLNILASLPEESIEKKHITRLYKVLNTIKANFGIQFQRLKKYEKLDAEVLIKVLQIVVKRIDLSWLGSVQLKEIEILDAAELPRLPSDHPVYKCKNCGTVFHFN